MQLKHVVIAHRIDRRSQQLAEKCARELEAIGAKVEIGQTGPQHNPYPVFLAEAAEPIDLAVVLGGDGSTLAAARHLSESKIPILAVNVGGHLGFLTEPAEVFRDTPQVWERLQGDRYAVQRRMMLEARVVDGPRVKGAPVFPSQKESELGRYLALNEMCVKPAAIDRMPSSVLEVEIDGDIVDQFQGDGLLVATPTGSTGYTASANGPILHPGMDAIAITPICPLSLSSRTIVLPPGSVVSIWPLEDPERATKLWTDGVSGTSVWPGQRVDVRRARCLAKFILLRENYSFYGTLREKLQWAGGRFHYENDRN